MPAPCTADELVDLVRKSGLADQARLESFLSRPDVAATLAAASPPELAGMLVQEGLVTGFQAEQLLMGKWRGFSIGKYKVLGWLGSGLGGSVYLCEHEPSQRRVAVKVLPPVRAEDPTALERFYREARILTTFNHPNIVRAYDLDQEKALHFLVMEHVDGPSLLDITQQSGPLAVPRAVDYLRQAAVGLQHIHDARVVHRDLKPADILVDQSGCVKIIDMGYARFVRDAAEATLDVPVGVFPRAPDYAAPELAVDPHGVDGRADLYGLGATFYFCLTGRPPLPDGLLAHKLAWLRTRRPDPIQALRPEVPEGLAVLIERMLAKSPDQRPQTAQEVADALAS